MLVIFPFETAIYERAGVPVEFVGHPLVDLAAPTVPRDAFLRIAGLDPGRPVVALLPGSRPNELRHVLPTVVDAARRTAAAVPGAQFLVARAPASATSSFDPLMPSAPPPCRSPSRTATPTTCWPPPTWS